MRRRDRLGALVLLVTAVVAGPGAPASTGATAPAAGYRATGPDRVGFHYAIAQPVGGEQVIPGGYVVGFPLPQRRTVLHNTAGVEWSGVFDVVVDPEGDFLFESTNYAPPRRLRSGATTSATWNPAVHGPLVSAVGLMCAATPDPSQRTGDVIFVAIAMFGDGAGRPGCTEAGSGRTTLLRNGTVVDESPWPGHGEFTLAPEVADYRLEVDQEQWPGAHLSTRTTAAWTFRSAHVPGDDPGPLPLLAVRWAPHLDDHNRAPAGRRVEVPVTVDRLGPVGRVRTPIVEASFDDGATWREVAVRRSGHGGDGDGDGGFVATIRHPAGAGFVSLRASARDDRGNAVEQTTIRAYELAPER